MSGLGDIPMEELLRDRQQSYNSLILCLLAKVGGIETYPSGSIDERMNGELAIIGKIEPELRRRGVDWL